MKPLSFRLYKTYLILFAITGISLLSISNVYSFLSGKISSSLFPDISFINIHGNLTLESLRATGSEGIKELKDSKGKVLRFTDEALDEIVKANTDQDFGVFPEVEGAAELSPVNHFDVSP